MDFWGLLGGRVQRAAMPAGFRQLLGQATRLLLGAFQLLIRRQQLGVNLIDLGHHSGMFCLQLLSTSDCLRLLLIRAGQRPTSTLSDTEQPLLGLP